MRHVAGIHGTFNVDEEARTADSAVRVLSLGLTVCPFTGSVSVKIQLVATRMRGHVPTDLSFLDLLFNGCKVGSCANL